jgi:hypothetical protein
MGQYFRLDGLTGFLIAVALLLSILAFLTINAIAVQQREATNAYKINQNTDALKFVDVGNKQHYQLVGSN